MTCASAKPTTRLQAQRFTAKQVRAPQTVLRLTEEGEPRRTTGSGFWPVMFSENPAHHVLVDIHAESQSDLLGNSRTTPGRVTSLSSRTASIHSWAGPFGPGRPLRLDENSMRYFRFVSR